MTGTCPKIVEHFGADRAFLEDIGMEAKGLEFSEYMPKESLAQQGGYGLAGMAERAGEIGWDLEVESHPGQGTSIRVTENSA